MLGDISQGGVRYDSHSLYSLVMISNKAKLIDHCPKTLPSMEGRGFDDETGRPPVASMCGSTAFASFTKSSCSIADFGCTCRMECSVSRLYHRRTRLWAVSSSWSNTGRGGRVSS